MQRFSSTRRGSSRRLVRVQRGSPPLKSAVDVARSDGDRPLKAKQTWGRGRPLCANCGTLRAIRSASEGGPTFVARLYPAPFNAMGEYCLVRTKQRKRTQPLRTSILKWQITVLFGSAKAVQDRDAAES
jgi:hypothetical protein